ncbi:MAG TPA: hypothetical protein VEW70_15190, partial [Burkholderiales bacterium]|nr:hypothetical protein [Burkholderiales bacterium]
MAVMLHCNFIFSDIDLERILNFVVSTAKGIDRCSTRLPGDRNASLLRCLDQWRSPGVGAESFLEPTWERTFKPEEGLPGRIWTSG